MSEEKKNLKENCTPFLYHLKGQAGDLMNELPTELLILTAEVSATEPVAVR